MITVFPSSELTPVTWAYTMDEPAADWMQPGFDDSTWSKIILPKKVQEIWRNINGIFWFRKEIEVPAEWEGKELTLSLGPVDDYDETYWDGQMVGFGRQWNKNREYTVPGRLVKKGRAVITIRCTDDHGDGGLYGDPRLLYVQGPDGRKIMLDNVWKVTLSVSFEGIPKSTAREPNMVTVLYNAMIKPLAPYAIKGSIWYQGESNASWAYRYRELMPAMIADWRATWGYDFPFYLVQICGYTGVKPAPAEDNWAELREAQAMTVNASEWPASSTSARQMTSTPCASRRSAKGWHAWRWRMTMARRLSATAPVMPGTPSTTASSASSSPTLPAG